MKIGLKKISLKTTLIKPDCGKILDCEDCPICKYWPVEEIVIELDDENHFMYDECAVAVIYCDFFGVFSQKKIIEKYCCYCRFEVGCKLPGNTCQKWQLKKELRKSKVKK